MMGFGPLLAICLLTPTAAADDDTKVDPGVDAFAVIVELSEAEAGRVQEDREVVASQPITRGDIVEARVDYLATTACTTGFNGLTCFAPTPCAEGEFTMVTHFAYALTDMTLPSNCTPTPGQDPTAVINAAVYQAFRDVPLPQTVLQIQPPDGTTLVNLATNFFTTTQPFTTTVTVLGYTVELDITPTTYTWDFGDGTTTTTTTPGAPYPDLDITHVYTRTGTYPTTLTTTWSADFRVDGRDWQRVQGTVDMPSPTLDLQVREATPVLTG
ncbi:hypothetical protein QE405_000429 [Nocardioides zeae]|uniref:PKD domain-containing protein n=1 Tax=Nocardioides zeae TaxID=1457234 RepID=A0AAJ1TW65_9ACTN|nr:hypothetical protein [Nocardioides zeae]